MELRVELGAEDLDATEKAEALDELTHLLQDLGIAYGYDDAHDPRALGPDPVVIITVTATVVQTLCAALTTWNLLRTARLKSGEHGTDIGDDAGRLGARIQSWLPTVEKQDATRDD